MLAAQVHAEAERKKEEIRERAERQLAAELERQAATEEERERLRADLVRQETERKAASQRKRALAAKLKGMENKLLKGGALAASRRVETPSTRVHHTRSWLVSGPNLRRFGPSRGRPGVSERAAAAMASSRRHDAVDVAVRQSRMRELRQFRECRSSQASSSTRPRRRKPSCARPSRN